MKDFIIGFEADGWPKTARIRAADAESALAFAKAEPELNAGDDAAVVVEVEANGWTHWVAEEGCEA